jgi:hypothetical protein
MCWHLHFSSLSNISPLVVEAMYSTPRLPAATGVLTGLTLCFLRSLFPLAAMGPSSDFRQVWNWVKTHDWRKTGRNAVRRKYWGEFSTKPSTLARLLD